MSGDQDTLLTKRYLEILKLLTKGYTSKQMGNALGITELTVKTHRRNLMKKLQVNNAQQLVAWAYKQKVLK